MTTTREIINYLRTNNAGEHRALIGLRKKDPNLFNQKIEHWNETIEQDDILIKPDLELPEDLDNKPLHYLNYNDFHNWEECKQLSMKYLDKTDKFMVFVSKGDIFKGRFLNKAVPYKQEFKLATSVEFMQGDQEKVESIKTIQFLDDTRDKRKKVKKIGVIEKSFWTYQFESNQREYIVFSEKEQALENCILEGTLIKFEDEFKIGESLKLNKNASVILLHSVTTSKPVFKSHKELIEKTTKIKLDHKKYFNWLFSCKNPDDGHRYTYNHPDYFQYLVSSFLLSAKESFPLHLTILATPGTGKSTVEECIYEKYDEETEILEGSGSTIKSLIPSFKAILPEAGIIFKSNRLCVVDEFFKILLRIDSHDRHDQLGVLNPLLEHRDRLFMSGNGGIKGHATARCLFVCNTKNLRGTSTIDQLAEHIETSFLSRLLVWYQDKEHIKTIEKYKLASLKKSNYKIDQDLWLGIVDYLHSFKAEYDKDKLNEIVKLGEISLGIDDVTNDLRKVKDEIYHARCGHHSRCLLDGIIKTRCICDQDISFKATKKDYLTFKIIWFRMLIGWGVEFNSLDTSLISTQIY